VIFKQKKVRRSDKFRFRYVRARTSRREVLASQYSIAVVQAALGIALLVASYESFRVFRLRGPSLPFLAKYSLSFLFLLGGIFSLRSGLRRFRILRRDGAKGPSKPA
jgi:hypothetical protein